MCRHAHRHHLVRNIWYLLIYTIPCFLLQVNCQICQRIHIGIVQDDGTDPQCNGCKSHFRQCMYPSGSKCMGAFCGAEMDGENSKAPGRNGTSRREACGSFCFSACRLSTYGIGRQPFAGVRALSFTAAAFPAGTGPSTTGRLPLPPRGCRSRSRCRRHRRPRDPCR